MLFSVYFVLGQSIVIGPIDFEWLFLNSIFGIREGHSVMLFIIQSFWFLGFYVFCFDATVHVMQFYIFYF